MSATYDEYKEEALRLLVNERSLSQSVRHHIGSLRAPFLNIDVLSGNHCRTLHELFITVNGSCSIIDPRPPGPHHEMVKQARRQRRWVVRKLRDLGETLDAASTRVSSNHGIVYFWYRFSINMDSHLADT